MTTSSLRTIAGDGLFGSVTSKLGGVGAFYTTKVGGLEMGLSIRRSVIERYQGRLWDNSS